MSSATPQKPFKITKDEGGQMRLTVRETRHNSQGYPWVTEVVVDESFANAAAARAFATEHYGAEAGQFSSK
jgi:hypothetical protein